MAAKKSGGNAQALQYTVIKVRLYPTEEQAEHIEKTFGCCRWLWNQMLSDTREFYAATDLQYIPTPARYKKEAPFLKEVDSQPLCTVHQNLRKAFLDFFRNPSAVRAPQFKPKKARRDSFTSYCRQYRTGPTIYMTADGVRLPKLGLVRAKVHRKPLHWWAPRSATVTKTRSGKYFCSVTFAYAARQPEKAAPARETALGLHYSPGRFYVDSGGHSPAPLLRLENTREKLARIQQKLSRMERGSRNYERQLQKLRLLHEHAANQRKDFIHKESRRIANAWDAVCVRDFGLAELARGRRGSAPMDAGFGMFRECLRYKLERQGKAYIAVDRRAPVARTCGACGAVNEDLPAQGGDWICPHCGAAVPRAVNAARNLRDMGLARYREQCKETGAA